MARGGSGGGGKAGKGGGGKGRGPTQRSQDYLARYGYPSSRELRREAEGLAGASVSSIRQTEQPFQRQAQSARDFLAAVQSALAETQGQVGAGYDQATATQSALDAATQSRLAGLGLGADTAGVQAATGARGDSATANLISNEASAKAYAAAQPGIAAGNTGVTLAGIRKQQTDALSARRDQLRQSFFQALQQVQSNALARAGFNQSSDQFAQNMHLQQQQLAASEAANAASARASQASASISEAHWRADYIGRYGIDPYTGKSVGKGKGGQTLAQSLGLTPNEVIGYQGKIADNIQAAKAGIPWTTSTGTVLPNHWKVHPAPNGAPREPNQANSIFYLYNFLAQRYPEPLVLQELRAAYPTATWNAFTRVTFPQQDRQIRRAAAAAGRAPWGKVKGPRRG